MLALALLLAFAQQDKGHVVTASPLKSEKRYALIVGNHDYAKAPLKNTVNDSDDMAVTLAAFGFSVTVVENTKRISLARAVETSRR